MTSKLITVDVEEFLKRDFSDEPEIEIDTSDPNDLWLPDDGRYPVRLKYNGTRTREARKTSKKYIEVYLEATVVRALGRSNQNIVGRCLYDRVTTIPYRWNGQKLTGISRLLDALGVDRRSLRSPKSLVNGLVKALESEPLVMIDTQWQAYSREARKVVRRAMSTFPKGKDGKPIPKIEFDFERIKAQARIVQFGRPSEADIQRVRQPGNVESGSDGNRTLTSTSKDSRNDKSEE